MYNSASSAQPILHEITGETREKYKIFNILSHQSFQLKDGAIGVLRLYEEFQTDSRTAAIEFEGRDEKEFASLHFDSSGNIRRIKFDGELSSIFGRLSTVNDVWTATLTDPDLQSTSVESQLPSWKKLYQTEIATAIKFLQHYTLEELIGKN